MKNTIASIILLAGFCMWVFFVYVLLKDAFKADYVQIAPLIMGVIFGLFALLTLGGLLSLFIKEDIQTVTQNINKEPTQSITQNINEENSQPITQNVGKKKLKLVYYLPSALCFIFAILSVTCNRQRNSEYAEIILTQVNKSEIKRTGKYGRSKIISIETKEYPKYKFRIFEVAFQYFNPNYYVNNVKQGDVLHAKICKDVYDKKIAKTKRLNFFDKTVNYHFITIYGLKHQNIVLLSTSNYEHAAKNDAVGLFFFFIACGGGILFLIHISSKAEEELNVNNLTEEQLIKLGLNQRQIKAVLYVKEKGKITNKEYRELNHISKKTAAYELAELVETYKIFKQQGENAGTYYETI